MLVLSLTLYCPILDRRYNLSARVDKCLFSNSGLQPKFVSTFNGCIETVTAYPLTSLNEWIIVGQILSQTNHVLRSQFQNVSAICPSVQFELVVLPSSVKIGWFSLQNVCCGENKFENQVINALSMHIHGWLPAKRTHWVSLLMV